MKVTTDKNTNSSALRMKSSSLKTKNSSLRTNRSLLRMLVTCMGMVLSLLICSTVATYVTAEEDEYTLREGYFTFSGEDAAWTSDNPNLTRNYVKGKKCIINYDYEAYFTEDVVNASHGVYDSYYYWEVAEYKEGAATGRTLFLTTYGDENYLDMDTLCHLSWSESEAFYWEENTEYHISVRVIEYLSDSADISVTHAPLRDCVVTYGTNEIANWCIELMNFVPDHRGSIKLNEDYGESRYIYFRDTQIRGTSGVEFTLDDLTFVQNETYRFKVIMIPKDGWTFPDTSKGKVTSADGVVISDLNFAYYDDSLMGRVAECSFNVTITGQLMGNATISNATVDSVKGCDIDTNAAYGLYYQYLVNGTGYAADISRSASGAYNNIKARYGAGLLGQTIQLKVTADNYVGAILSNSVVVEKTTSYLTPEEPELSVSGSGGSYTVTINNYTTDQDYVYSSTLIPMEQYGTINFDESVGSSFDVSGGYVYVYTRVAENGTAAGGEEIACAATYAGDGGSAQGIVIDQYKVVVEAEWDVTLTATILPLGQADVDESAIEWYVIDGNKESLVPVINGEKVAWPGVGEGYITGAQLTLEGVDFGIVEVGVKATLSSGQVLTQSCTVIVTVDENAFITDIVQPSDTIYLYPGSTYTVTEYTVYPVEARGLWTPCFVVYNEADDTNGKWSMTPGGIFVIEEDCPVGTTICFGPYYDEYYAYAYEGRAYEPSLRYIEIVDAESQLYFNRSEYTGLVDEELLINASTYGAGTLIFESSDSSVASVDETGMVKLLAAGTATITGYFGGKVATCVVTVEACHHHFVYEDNGDGTHSAACDICGLVNNEQHSYSNWASVDEHSHIQSCICGISITEEHVWYHDVSASYSGEIISDVCSVCGYADKEIRDTLLHANAGSEGEDSATGNDGGEDDGDGEGSNGSKPLGATSFGRISQNISKMPVWGWIIMILCVIAGGALAVVLVLRHDLVKRMGKGDH